MSDADSSLTPSSPEPAEAPQGTAEIAANVIESYESPEPESGDGSMPEQAQEAAPPAAEVPGVVKPPLSEEEQLLAEFGFKEATHPDGRDFRIPRSKVLKMIASGLKRGQDKWTAERTPLETELSSYKERFSSVQPILEMLDQGPEAFLAEAAKHDPKYKAFLESRAQPQAPAAPQNFPDPDLPLPDGSRTYTVKGLQESVFPWMLEQARAIAKSEAEAALKPITEREKQAQEREAQAQWDRQRREQYQATMAEAQTWAHFGKLPEDGSLTEFQAEVLKELQADTAKAEAEKRKPTLTLERAYARVVSRRVSEDEKVARARFAKEVSAAAKASPSVPRSGAETPAPARPATTQDIAARALARLEGGA